MGRPDMGSNRKGLVTSSEPADVVPNDAPKQDDPAQPPEERLPTREVTRKRPRRSRDVSDVTRPLLIVRVRSKPKQLAPASEAGTPDWSLSAGVATVLFGLAIAFGTYVTLTQRDAVQSRLRHFADLDKPRAAARHDPVPI